MQSNECEARRVVEELQERADVQTWVSQCRAAFNDPDGEIRHYRRAEMFRALAAMVERLASAEDD